MSPEMKRINNANEIDISFNPEKSDIFSLGITMLEYILLLEKNDLNGLNDENNK